MCVWLFFTPRGCNQRPQNSLCRWNSLPQKYCSIGKWQEPFYFYFPVWKALQSALFLHFPTKACWYRINTACSHKMEDTVSLNFDLPDLPTRKHFTLSNYFLTERGDVLRVCETRERKIGKYLGALSFSYSRPVPGIPSLGIFLEAEATSCFRG